MGTEPLFYPKEEAILSLHKAGYILIPLKGKVPTLSGWQKLKVSAIKADHKGNYGVVLQEEDLVIDIDPRNFPPDRDVLQEFNTKLGIKKYDTYKVKTGGGGLHVYYKKPKDAYIKHTLEEFPGIEFKTYGRQVVGPFSVHPETHQEYLPKNSTIRVKTVPDRILNLIQSQQKIEGKEPSPQQDSTGAKKRFVQYLMQTATPAVQGARGDETTYQVALYGRDLGLSESAAYNLMLEFYNPNCSPPWSRQELQEKVANAYKYAKGAQGNRTASNISLPQESQTENIGWDFKKGSTVLRPTLFNAVNFFKIRWALDNCLSLNEFTGDIEFVKPAPWHKDGTYAGNVLTWTDSDAVLAKYYLSVKHQFDASVNIMHEAAIVTATSNSYHPVRNYLDSLEWDRTPRLDRWLSAYANAEDNQYTRAVGAKTLLAAVARIYRPGIKYEYILTLEGPQGCGKSTLCAILGGPYHTDIDVKPTEKDTVSDIMGKWIVEISEMYSQKKSDVDAMKSFIARTHDRARLPYMRASKDYPRQNIFIGTLNPEPGVGYLRDRTGNRRFWPVTVGQVDFAGLRQDRDQLFAEAVVRYKKGEPVYLDSQRIENLAREQAELRKTVDPWFNRVSHYLANNKDNNGFLPEEYTVDDIYIGALRNHIRYMSFQDTVRISSILASNGWTANAKKTKSGIIQVFKRPKK